MSSRRSALLGCSLRIEACGAYCYLIRLIYGRVKEMDECFFGAHMFGKHMALVLPALMGMHSVERNF